MPIDFLLRICEYTKKEKALTGFIRQQYHILLQRDNVSKPKKNKHSLLPTVFF